MVVSLPRDGVHSFVSLSGDAVSLPRDAVSLSRDENRPGLMFRV